MSPYISMRIITSLSTTYITPDNATIYSKTESCLDKKIHEKKKKIINPQKKNFNKLDKK